MKIVFFKELGRAVFAEEVTESFSSGKILTQVIDSDGKPVASAINLCGSRFHISGIRDGIPESAVREGVHPLTVQIGDKIYPVGTATRIGNKVSFNSSDVYKLFVEAAMLADKSYSKVVEYGERIAALEISAHGVDLMNLT